MFLDNATVHRHLNLSNVKLKSPQLRQYDLKIPTFRPRHYASDKGTLPQVLGADIIVCNPTSSSAIELWEQINILDTIHWIHKAWNEVKASEPLSLVLFMLGSPSRNPNPIQILKTT